MLIEVYENEKEKVLFSTWQGLYPFMQIGATPFISFKDFKNELYSSDQMFTNITFEEVEEDIDRAFGLR